MLTNSCRCTLLNRKTHTALSAASTSPTRSPSTRRVRTLPLLRVRDATTPSKRVSVARPSPSSERRPRPPRRLPSSLSATNARSADVRSLADASHSFLERKKTLRVRSFSELCVPYWLPRRESSYQHDQTVFCLARSSQHKDLNDWLPRKSLRLYALVRSGLNRAHLAHELVVDCKLKT